MSNEWQDFKAEMLSAPATKAAYDTGKARDVLREAMLEVCGLLMIDETAETVSGFRRSSYSKRALAIAREAIKATEPA